MKKAITKVKQKAFLAGFARAGSVLGASHLTKIDRSYHYDWLKSDQEYQRDFLHAKAETIDRLEHELNRRAFVGIRKPVIYKGALQFEPARDAKGNVKRDKRGQAILSTDPLFLREYSDTLLMFWLKSLDRPRFQDNQNIQVSGPAEGPIPISIDVRFVNAPPQPDGPS